MIGTPLEAWTEFSKQCDCTKTDRGRSTENAFFHCLRRHERASIYLWRVGKTTYRWDHWIDRKSHILEMTVAVYEVLYRQFSLQQFRYFPPDLAKVMLSLIGCLETPPSLGKGILGRHFWAYSGERRPSPKTEVFTWESTGCYTLEIFGLGDKSAKFVKMASKEGQFGEKGVPTPHAFTKSPINRKTPRRHPERSSHQSFTFWGTTRVTVTRSLPLQTFSLAMDTSDNFYLFPA